MAFVEDFAPMFADFGTAAVVGGVSLSGIFDNDYAIAMGFASGGTPVLLIFSAAAPSVAVGNAVTVGAVSYTVVAVEPDGTGMTALRLQEA